VHILLLSFLPFCLQKSFLHLLLIVGFVILDRCESNNVLLQFGPKLGVFGLKDYCEVMTEVAGVRSVAGVSGKTDHTPYVVLKLTKFSHCAC